MMGYPSACMKIVMNRIEVRKLEKGKERKKGCRGWVKVAYNAVPLFL